MSLVVVETNEVALEHGDGDFADCRDVDGGLLLDLVAVKVLEGREVDADGSITDQVRGDLVGGRGDTGDDNIREGEDIFNGQGRLGNLFIMRMRVC